MRLDTDALAAFVAVVNTGSFSQAAQQLHLTQPAVSKRVRGLEQQLSTPLLERYQRRIRLTEAGRTLYQHGTEVLQALRNAEQAVAALSTEVSGTLHMASSHHIGLHHLPDILRRFRQQYPQVEFHIHFLESEKAFQLLESGEIELAFVTLPDQATLRRGGHAHFQHRAIWPDPLHFVCSPEHALAQRAACSLADVCAVDAILPSPSTHTHRIVQALFEAEGLTLNTALPTNFLETIKMMVSVGLGWSVLPATMVDDQLRVLQVNAAPLHRELGIMWDRRRRLSNAAQALLDGLFDRHQHHHQPST